jgi:hypothetical protein
MAMMMAVTPVLSKPTATPEMMFVDGYARDDVRGRAGLRRLRQLLHGPPAAGGVVLGNVDEGHAREQPGQSRQDEPEVVEHVHGDDRDADRGDDGHRPVALVELPLRVADVAQANGQDADDRGQDADRAHDQREEDPGRVPGHKVEGDAQDHGADVLGGGGLEQVGTAAGAVADVVADQVRDHGRVARVVLGDARLDLAHQVGAHVRGLGVDATAELREQCDEAGAETEADDLEGNLGHARVQAVGARVEAAKEREDAQHTEQAQRHHQEPGHGAAAERDDDCLLQAALSGGGGAHVGLDGDVHADEARQARTEGAQQEGDRRLDG